jgi:hypothetical protein
MQISTSERHFLEGKSRYQMFGLFHRATEVCEAPESFSLHWVLRGITCPRLRALTMIKIVVDAMLANSESLLFNEFGDDGAF